jgi:hypothetical protein
MVYEPPAQIERAPLPPPLAYASATNKTPAPWALSGHSPDDDGSKSKATAGEWRSSPRWAAVKGQDCIVIEPDAQAKFAAADSAKVKIQNCSKEDLRVIQEVGASQSAAQESSPRSPQSELPFGSDEPSPANPPTLPPSENPSDGAIEPWTGAI